MIKLGSKGRDRITGFAGVITGRCEYLTGCNRVLLSPHVGADGSYKEPQWFDEQCIEIDDAAGVIALDNGSSPGFGKEPPKR